VALKQSSFTFTAPKIPIKSLDTAELPKFASSSSAVASPVASPKATNPPDWSSLSTFDPAMLNLLDDSVSQPTATEGAMQMDFGFGRNTGLASNFPYTTIASNPTFMSFASTFDSPSNTSAPTSNSYVSGPFNFDMNSMSTWSPPPTTSQDAQLDDLFTGYLSTMNPTDFLMQPQSSVSVSPVSHHIATPFRSGTSQNSSSSPPSAAPQASKSSPDSASSVREKAHSRNKMLEELISGGEPSPFATGTLQCPLETATTTTIPCGEGAAFPKTIKSDKNIEVMTAWKSITSDPKFKVCFSITNVTYVRRFLMPLCRTSISVLCVASSPVKHVAMVLGSF
jgi:AP-1-like factor